MEYGTLSRMGPQTAVLFVKNQLQVSEVLRHPAKRKGPAWKPVRRQFLEGSEEGNMQHCSMLMPPKKHVAFAAFGFGGI